MQGGVFLWNKASFVRLCHPRGNDNARPAPGEARCAVSQQLDRAVEVPFQPFGVDACYRVIVQCFVHAGDVLYLLQHRPDVMADEG